MCDAWGLSLAGAAALALVVTANNARAAVASENIWPFLELIINVFPKLNWNLNCEGKMPSLASDAFTSPDRKVFATLAASFSCR